LCRRHDRAPPSPSAKASTTEDLRKWAPIRLRRYLSGAGDWDIGNDPAWTAYMRANPSLKVKMAKHAR